MTSTPAQDLTQLREILQKKSVRFGSFTLASGQTSDVYVDCRLTTYDPRAMSLAAQGRTFALLAVRQQLLWVVGALIPVAVALSFGVGDRALAVVAGAGAVVYGLGRRASR